jgi:creatinine amidohydrolase
MWRATPSRAGDISPHRGETGAGSPRHAERRLAAMTWHDVRDALDHGRDRVVVPFGAVEQHGAHLPLETDALLGDCLGPLLADRLDALCAPTVRIGCSEDHMGRAGTLSLRPMTLKLIVCDLVDSLARHGFRTIVLLPTHAGNAAPLAHAACTLEPPSGVRIVAVADMRALARALQAASTRCGSAVAATVTHAGEIETSLMLAIAPAAVRTPCDRGNASDDRGRSSERLRTASLPSSAAAGDVRRATEAAGRSYIAAFLMECVRQLEVQGVRSCAYA